MAEVQKRGSGAATESRAAKSTRDRDESSKRRDKTGKYWAAECAEKLQKP